MSQTQALSDSAKKIIKIAKVVRFNAGFSLGVDIFIFGPLYYERLAQFTSATTAMTITTLMISISSILRLVLEVPTGAIADTLGRKKIIILSLNFSVLDLAFMALLCLAPNLTIMLALGSLAQVTYSFSYSFFNGTFTAWCIDNFKAHAPEVGTNVIMARSYTQYFIGMMIGGVLSVYLYLHGFAYIAFLIAAVGCVVCITFCLGEMEDEPGIDYIDVKRVGFSAITQRIGRITGDAFQVFRKSPVILSLVVVYACFFFVINIVDYLWPVYLRSSIDPAIQSQAWIGLVLVLLAFTIIGSKLLTPAIQKWGGVAGSHHQVKGLHILLFASCLISAVPILILSYSTLVGNHSFWIFMCAIIPVEFAYGIIAPCFDTLINHYISDSNAPQRATILSFASLLRSFLIIILSVPAGGSTGKTSPIGWAIPAGLLLIVTVIGFLIVRKRSDQISDVIALREENSMVDAMTSNGLVQ